MSLFMLAARGVSYFRRMHGGVCLGVMLASGILCGALIVGDSVDYSLRGIADARLGGVGFAMNWGSRFFAESLCARMNEKLPGVNASSVLLLSGTISKPNDGAGKSSQLNRVNILGVSDDFWRFAKRTPGELPRAREAFINKKTAEALGVHVGDDLSLRVTLYGDMPLDAPLSSRLKKPTANSLITAARVLSDEEFGSFSLAANQIAPYNVFVNLAWLQEFAKQKGMVNVALAGAGCSSDELGKLLEETWTLDDVGAHVDKRVEGVLQVESAHVFLEDEIVRAAMELPGARPTLTYLVNSISKGDKSTPYSFVEAGPAPEGMNDDEVVISQWLAEQLGAGIGDSLDLSYYRLTPSNALEEQKKTFKVSSVTTMDSLRIERELAPVFPGLSDVESCRDWNVGMPMDEEKLKDKPNEDYWRQYGQTPKLLTTFNAGRSIWGNRFGSVTAVRVSGTDAAEARHRLRNVISAKKLGLTFVPVSEYAKDAVDRALDFGGLFVGMSFFLIAASLILVGLLHVFGIQQRACEIGVLFALGFSRRSVLRLILMESFPGVFAGSLLGALVGVAYAKSLLLGLSIFWPDAVVGTKIHLHASISSISIGVAATVVAAMLVITITQRVIVRRTPRELMSYDFATSIESANVGKPWKLTAASATGFVISAVIAAVVLIQKPTSYIEPFFMVGTLLLLSGLGFLAAVLTRMSGRVTFAQPRLWKIALANIARRRGRAMSVAGLTACGCFLVFSVSSMRANVALHVEDRFSGAGGFGVYAETTAPILGDAKDVEKTLGASAVSLRVRDGDDASCLNLNRARFPRIIGVDAARLEQIGAFVPSTKDPLWSLLQMEPADGAIPALVGDSDTAMWGLQKKTGVRDGDIIEYRDEMGREVKIKLVGKLPMRLSVFQGSLLIADSAFTRLFPSESGFRAFLVKSSSADAVNCAARLNSDLERYGMDAVPSANRLRDFYAVESTYLAMFLVLGGLGMALGGGGVGIVTMRNIFERRRELALLHAVGFEVKTIRRALLLEHAALVFAGMTIGTLSAAAAAFPLMLSSQTNPAMGAMAVLFVMMVVANVFCVSIGTKIAAPRNPVSFLRAE